MDLHKQLQWNLTNIINMGHIQTYASVLSTVELTTGLKQYREKWRVMFHTCIKLFLPTPAYVCIYYTSSHRWSMTHSAQVSQKQDRCNIYAIMKIMCHPGYHHNGFEVTKALGHMINNVAIVNHGPKCMMFW